MRKTFQKQPCNVVYTDYRPTPLQHYIFPCGGDGLHLIVNDKREFNDSEFSNAMNVLRNAGDMAKGDNRNRRGQRGSGTQEPGSSITGLICYVSDRIVFYDVRSPLRNSISSFKIKRKTKSSGTVKHQKTDQILP